jgi:hypothetical protein
MGHLVNRRLRHGFIVAPKRDDADEYYYPHSYKHRTSAPYDHRQGRIFRGIVALCRDNPAVGAGG